MKNICYNLFKNEDLFFHHHRILLFSFCKSLVKDSRRYELPGFGFPAAVLPVKRMRMENKKIGDVSMLTTKRCLIFQSHPQHVIYIWLLQWITSRRKKCGSLFFFTRYDETFIIKEGVSIKRLKILSRPKAPKILQELLSNSEQGRLKIWMEHSKLILLNPKPFEIL